jgi:2-hydroxy-6-oxonona-2,4-dienedioate hydrolase
VEFTELMVRHPQTAPTVEYVRGRRTASPIVMLPGLFAGGWIWKPTRDLLIADGFSVATISEPFAGLDTSTAAPTTAPVDALRAVLTAVLDQYGIHRAILLGNSMGALVALDAAYHHPNRVESLVISGCPGLGNGEGSSSGTLSRLDPRGIADRMFFDRSAIPEDLIERSLAAVSDRGFQMNMIRYLIAIREYDVKRCLSRIVCDVLMIWGENDLIAPVEEWEHHLHLAAPGSLHRVPRCGHSPMIEKPAEFNSILTQFLACAPLSSVGRQSRTGAACGSETAPRETVRTSVLATSRD